MSKFLVLAGAWLPPLRVSKVSEADFTASVKIEQTPARSSAHAFGSLQVAGSLLYSAYMNPESVGQLVEVAAASSTQAPAPPQLDLGVPQR